MDDNFTTSDDTPPDTIDRGKRRITLVQNKLAFEIFGQADDKELQITEADYTKCEVLAIRLLLALRDHGLLDNEPMLNLATLEELLKAVELRCDQLGMSIPEGTPVGYLFGMAQSARTLMRDLKDFPELLQHADKKRKPITLEDMLEDAENNVGDTTEEKDTQ